MLAYVVLVLESLQLLWFVIIGIFASIGKLLLPPKPKSIKNEVILVTGGSNGIGRALLFRLAMTDPEVTLVSWDVDEAANEGAIKEVRNLGVKRAFAFTVDVSNRNQVAIAAAKVREQAGDVTMIFNNAGITGPVGKCWEADLNLAQKTFEVNLFAHFYILQEFLPKMIAKNKGHIIPTCSFAGFAWGRDGAPYVGSKHAVHGYYECLKEDLRGIASDVKVSIVYPGLIATQMTAPFDFTIKAFKQYSKPTAPSTASNEIVKSVLRDEEHVYVPSIVRPFHSLLTLVSPDVYRKAYDMLDLQPLKQGTPSPKLENERD